MAVLRRLVPLACRLVSVVRGFAFVAAGAVVVIVASAAWVAWPLELSDGVALVVLTALLAIAPALVWLFGQALEEVVELPNRVSRLPGALRSSQGELASLVRDAQTRRRSGEATARPGDLWKAGRLLLGARDALPGYGAVLTLVRVPFLIASLFAALVCVGLVVAAPIALVGAAVSQAL